MYWLKPFLNVDKKTSSKGERGLFELPSKEVCKHPLEFYSKAPFRPTRENHPALTHKNTAPQ